MIDLFDYMGPYFKIKALYYAFKLKLIQRMMKNGGHMTKENLYRGSGINRKAYSFILKTLALYKIFVIEEEDLFLSTHFVKDYTLSGAVMLQIIKYMNLAYKDFESIDSLNRIGGPQGLISSFWGEKKEKEFCSFLSTLTRLEFIEICKIFDFSKCKHVLDIGGNDGEFILGLCKLYPHIKGGIVDRPFVCQLGRKKIGQIAASKRIQFFPGDFLVDDFPKTADLIVFKSVLNDLDDTGAIALLHKSYRALPPGGKIAIIEYMIDEGNDNDKRLFEIAFQYLIAPQGKSRFRRSSEYCQFLKQIGFIHVKARKMRLTNFYFIAAQKTEVKREFISARL